MMTSSAWKTPILAGLTGGFLTLAASAQFSAPPKLLKEVEVIMADSCFDCHDGDVDKGDVRLDNLASLPLDARLEMLNRIQEQVYFEQMPPKKKSQPSAGERQQLLAWLAGELSVHNASKLEDKLRYPAYGNAVDHHALFSGKNPSPGFTPARRWLVSPQIFHQRVVDIFKLEGKERLQPLYGVTNPFVLPDASGVRDYDTNLLDGGNLLVMLTNADWISGKQLHPARVKHGEIKAGVFANPQDKWVPKATPPAFEAIILKNAAPTDAELSEAIRTQFDCVLRREPTSQELAKYLVLTKTAMDLAGPTEGLRQMLVTVLLESEFLYRLEFGAGNPDSHGRKILAPREAADAISYALGDRGPDATLLAAANTGRLATREDFKREVTRLLAEPNYYRGPIDPSNSGMHLTSHETSHPKIVRFFREFFGYPNATKVFKDVERGEGAYSNAGRGTNATPGFLINEADRVVDRLLQKDKNLFESLLTTDEFFVYHNRSNEESAQIIETWRNIYETLKNTDWKKNPEQVTIQHALLLKPLGIKPNDPSSKGNHATTVTRVMNHFEMTFGKGITPFTTLPWAHGNSLWHSPIYNLGITPRTESKPADDTKLFDYAPVQPFKVANRKGILSHPSWLIAHSKNTHNDPVTRGRWVREKLLAGRVPDVPITVDAAIPEDHDKTLRSRLEMKTEAPECMKCHEYMNPLGLPFEIFDDFGRYRVEEFLEHPEKVIGKTGGRTPKNIYASLPINARGALDNTDNPALDGEVGDALEMIGKLAKSSRSRQSIIRYAFRFYMGRNEMLSDSQTLIDADKAYLASGGSFRAVILSLLTSDSFIYRK